MPPINELFERSASPDIGLRGIIVFRRRRSCVIEGHITVMAMARSDVVIVNQKGFI